MKEEDHFIAYLETLKSEDWEKQVSEKWTVKDVVAHMVGWERQDPQTLRESWENKEMPWWLKERDFDEFNRKNVEEFKSYTPEQLIETWQKYQKEVQEEMERIGYDNLLAYPDLFNYFTSGRNSKHYMHHLNQIKSVVEESK